MHEYICHVKRRGVVPSRHAHFANAQWACMMLDRLCTGMCARQLIRKHLGHCTRSQATFHHECSCDGIMWQRSSRPSLGGKPCQVPRGQHRHRLRTRQDLAQLVTENRSSAVVCCQHTYDTLQAHALPRNA